MGAGAAGLAAAGSLVRAGLSVRCLEAGSRAGGRILTLHETRLPQAIECGAEFIHGKPPELWRLARDSGLRIYEQTIQALYFDSGKILFERETGELAERVLERLPERRERDESLEEFLRRSRQKETILNWARAHVEGFNAARSESISVSALKKEARAADAIEGDRAFRLMDGYDGVILALLRSIPSHSTCVQLHSPVHRIERRAGGVTIRFRHALAREESSLKAKRVIVTVPLGVLQSGAIEFHPQPEAVLSAAATLQFGMVYKVVLRFDQPFWLDDEKLSKAGFLLSQEAPFPTWWTSHPVISPLLTGWSAGSFADGLNGMDRDAIISEALACLQRILGRKVPAPDEFWFHDWQADPLFRGAYSYVPVDGMAARVRLSRPVENTLFFAGEATDVSGSGGTVHGAIASGMRAAKQILRQT